MSDKLPDKIKFMALPRLIMPENVRPLRKRPKPTLVQRVTELEAEVHDLKTCVALLALYHHHPLNFVSVKNLLQGGPAVLTPSMRLELEEFMKVKTRKVAE
jgi:hypothetical protein